MQETRLMRWSLLIQKVHCAVTCQEDVGKSLISAISRLYQAVEVFLRKAILPERPKGSLRPERRLFTMFRKRR